MIGLRLTSFLVLVVAMAGGAEVKSQTADSQRPRLAERLAAEIAHEMDVRGTRMPPNTPVAFESATSHDQVVELRWVTRDPSLFSAFRNGFNSERVRVTKATRYCTERNMAAMTQGVVIHEILTPSDGSEPLDYRIDLSVCEVLPKLEPADPATLLELARKVASAEEARKARPSGWFRLDQAAAHDGVVEESYTIRDAAAMNAMLADRAHHEGVQKDYFCPTFRAEIFRGITLHLVYVSPDGRPVYDFAINRSNC